MKSLQQRYPGAALVTGASSGIGESFAKALAAEGFDLVLVARRKERLMELSEQLHQAHNVACLVVAEDLTTSGSVDRIAAAIAEKEWTVSLLINNAGFGSLAAQLDLPAERYLNMVDLNCRVPVELTHRFLPGMIEAGRGGIVFLASTVAYMPTPFMSVYGATKGFNLLLAESLYGECKQQGVDVLSLAPGYTATEFSKASEVDVDMPGFLVGTADGVVRLGLRQLGRKPSTVHGWGNWLVSTLIRFVPRRFVTWMSGQIVRRSSKKLLGSK
jgi:short-subunit dehydrogenase